AEYFSQSGIGSDVFGIRGRYFEHGRIKNMLLDRSPAFERGFQRFLEAKKREGEHFDLLQLETEKRLIHEYEISVEEMYCATAADELAANWISPIEVGFLGASPDLVMERIYETESPGFYSKQLFAWLCRDMLPSSVLL